MTHDAEREQPFDVGKMHYQIITRPDLCKSPPMLAQVGNEKLREPWTGEMDYKLFKQATIVDVSNVSKYYFETNPKPVWTLDEDFRGVTPPFETMWLEMPPIRREYSFTRKVWDDDLASGIPIRGYGVLVHRRDVRPEYIKNRPDERDINVEIPSWASPIFSPMHGVRHRVAIREHQLNARWNVRMWSLVQIDNEILGPLAINDFFLDEKGDCILEFPALGIFFDKNKERATTKAFNSHPQGFTEEQVDEWIEFSMANHRLLDVAFLALSFMNCRNVALRKRAAPPLSRAARRRGDPDRVEHHKIEITPMKPRAVLQRESIGVAADVMERDRKALHIVRGHFKHYGEQWGTQKLFGRVSGKFWWDKHTAGSIDAGLIESDYAVKP